MFWLISLVLAGAMFASDGSVPVRLDFGNTSENIEKIKRQDETERFEQTYPLNANGRVGVSNVNGSITIESWDRNEVKLEYVKTADSRERLSEIEIKIDARQDSIQVETNYDKTRRDSNGGDRSWKNNGKSVVEYHLSVPRRAVLNEIETVNGGISISNAANMTRASAVNGEVRATNLRGTANLSTVNGTVQADFDALERGSKISLDTVNGQVNLTIPSDANATVKADTLNGGITNDFGLPVRKGQFIGKNLYGRIGAGDVQIRLNSVNGGLSVKHKNDGKTVSPATNLLPPNSKTNDDFDKQINEDIGADEDKNPNAPGKISKQKIVKQTDINAAVGQAIGTIVKQSVGATAQITAEALKTAQREIARAQMNVNAGLFSNSPAVEKKSDSFAVKGVPNVTIEAASCDIAVRGWDKAEVSYTVVKIAANRNQTLLDVKSNQNVSDVNIKITNADSTKNGNFFDNSSRARIEIFVPQKSNLKIVGDGEIRLENVTGEIDLQGADEAVNIRDAAGKLSVGTNDGRIRVIGFRGAFDGKTGDGLMNLEGDFQSFNALAAGGTIILTLPDNANAVLEADTEIENDGLNLIRKNASEKSWSAGSGGAIYRFSAGDGKVIIRSANTIRTNEN